MKNYLLEFLRKERLVRKFKKNLASDSLSMLDEFVSKDVEFTDLIACAFIWNKTDEGQKFWSTVNTKWIKYYLRK